MIRFEVRPYKRGTIFEAEFGDTTLGVLLSDDRRRIQAGRLIDAAAALLEDDEEHAAEFEALHAVLDQMQTRIWQPIETAPEGVVVETKIDDEHGARNEQTLKRLGRLWWTPDGSMYVYYTPTHWRACAAESQT